jgi:hypothetical protein
MSKAIGMYVEYKNAAYLVVKDDGTQVHLNAPDSKRVKVNKSSIRRLELAKAMVVAHKGSDYIVTRKSNIFSATTGKLMNWSADNGDRKAILLAAAA